MLTIESIKLLVPLLVVVPAAIRGSERRMVRRFRREAADSSETALVIGRLNRLMAWQFRRLLRRGVLVETQSGRYFLSASGYASFRASRRSRALFIVAPAVTFAVLVAFLLRSCSP